MLSKVKFQEMKFFQGRRKTNIAVESKMFESPIEARCIHGADAVLALGTEWDDLMIRARDAFPFLAHPWIAPWIQAERFRGTPMAIAAWAGGRLVALVVLDVRLSAGILIAEPVGGDQPFYHGLLLDSDRSDAIAEMAAVCVAERVFHVLRILDMHSNDVATEAFLYELSVRGFSVARDFRAICHVITLGHSYESYLQTTKSKKSRDNLAREEKRLRQSHDVQISHLIGEAITADAVRRMAAVQEHSWMKLKGAAHFGVPFFQTQALSAAQGRIAHLWLLTLDGVDAAFVYTLVAHDQLHYCWTAFRLEYESLSVGKVLTNLTIRDACERGIRTFDFGHADAVYKRFWATDSHDVLRVVAGRGPRGLLSALRSILVWRLSRIIWIKTIYMWIKTRYRRLCSDNECGHPI